MLAQWKLVSMALRRSDLHWAPGELSSSLGRQQLVRPLCFNSPQKMLHFGFPSGIIPCVQVKLTRSSVYTRILANSIPLNEDYAQVEHSLSPTRQIPKQGCCRLPCRCLAFFLRNGPGRDRTDDIQRVRLTSYVASRPQVLADRCMQAKTQCNNLTQPCPVYQPFEASSEIQSARCHEKMTLDKIPRRFCYIRGVLINHHLVSWPNG